MKDNRVGEFLELRRKELQKSQWETAYVVGVSRQFWRDVELGNRKPSDRVLAAAAVALELDPLALFLLAGRLPPGCVPGNYRRATGLAQAVRSMMRCTLRMPPGTSLEVQDEPNHLDQSLGSISSPEVAYRPINRVGAP